MRSDRLWWTVLRVPPEREWCEVLCVSLERVECELRFEVLRVEVECDDELLRVL